MKSPGRCGPAGNVSPQQPEGIRASLPPWGSAPTLRRWTWGSRGSLCNRQQAQEVDLAKASAPASRVWTSDPKASTSAGGRPERSGSLDRSIPTTLSWLRWWFSLLEDLGRQQSNSSGVTFRTVAGKLTPQSSGKHAEHFLKKGNAPPVSWPRRSHSSVCPGQLPRGPGWVSGATARGSEGFGLQAAGLAEREAAEMKPLFWTNGWSPDQMSQGHQWWTGTSRNHQSFYLQQDQSSYPLQQWPKPGPRTGTGLFI